MKPFNLEEAKAGKPVCLRSGKPARVICFDRDDEYPIVSLHYGNTEEEIRTHCTNGAYLVTGDESKSDLMMATTKLTMTRYVSWHKRAGMFSYASEEDAREYSPEGCVVIAQEVTFEWEE